MIIGKHILEIMFNSTTDAGKPYTLVFSRNLSTGKWCGDFSDKYMSELCSLLNTHQKK